MVILSSFPAFLLLFFSYNLLEGLVDIFILLFYIFLILINLFKFIMNFGRSFIV